jgi:predicted phage tail protein
MAKKDRKQIIGAGGGGGGGGGQTVVQQTVVVQQAAPPPARTPTRTADNLASTAHATILDLISEGEIEGFPSARSYTRGTDNYNKALLKDVFLTDTPILRAGADVTNLSDSDYNFKGVTVTTRYGTNAQTHISATGFGDVEDIISVNTEVVQATPVTRQITDTNVDAVRVSIAVPRLEASNAQGDILGTSVELDIEVQYNGGGFTKVKDADISGRTADKYERDYLVELDGDFPVDIRVKRVSDDSTDTNVNPTFWTAYTEIIRKKLRYPNSALAAVRFAAEQFNNIPARSYRVRGIKVKIPNNATVDAATGRLTYSGTWTGTFGAAQWTTCPAWILYDLLINKRYGFGDHIAEAQLDKFAFLAASKYSNELVDDGQGGEEARFSCNALIQNQYEAYKLVNDLCSVMRCQPFWSTGSLTLTQDKPTDATYLFNRANVLEPGFSYAGSDVKTRHTVAVVSYLDLERREQNYEMVEDRDGIEKYGWVATQVKAFACTSRGQANRLGRWILFSEQNETNVITFSASIDAGAVVRPGAVIDVQDPVRAGVRYGGRISSATVSTVTVDDADGLPEGDATLSVLLSDGTLETRDISSRDGTTITVSSDFTSAPNTNSVWIVQTDSIQTQQFRVLTVNEKEPAIYEITALEYNANKYGHVEDGFKLDTRDITNLNPIPGAPGNLQAEEKFYASNDKAKVKIILSWEAVKGAPQYKVRYRRGSDNWETMHPGKPDVEILDTTDGTYEFEVYTINSLGRQSTDFGSLTFTAIGKTAVPGQVQNLSFEATSSKEGTLKWDETVDLDVKHGGKVYIRHSNKTDGTGTWSNSVDLIEAVAGSATSAKISLIEGEVLVKFADDGGRLSTNETSIIIDLPDTQGKLALQTRREDLDDPPFQGTRTDCFYSDEYDALTIDGDDDIDDVTDFDDIDNFDFSGDVLSSAEYEFVNTLDLEGVFSLDLKRRFVTRGFYPSDLIDSRSESIDDWDEFDGDEVDQVNAKLYVRKTDDDPTGTPTWGSWNEFANGTFKGRAFQFKAELESSNTAQNILIDELGYVAEFERRTESSESVIASGTGTKSVTFANAFFTGTTTLLGANSKLPTVGITANNMQSGDYFTLSNITGTGFDVAFFNSSDVGIDRNFNYSAVGYGKAG